MLKIGENNGFSNSNNKELEFFTPRRLQAIAEKGTFQKDDGTWEWVDVNLEKIPNLPDARYAYHIVDDQKVVLHSPEDKDSVGEIAFDKFVKAITDRSREKLRAIHNMYFPIKERQSA